MFPSQAHRSKIQEVKLNTTMQFKTGLLFVLAVMLLVTVIAEAQNNNCPRGRRGRRGRGRGRRSIMHLLDNDQVQSPVQQLPSQNVMKELKWN